MTRSKQTKQANACVFSKNKNFKHNFLKIGPLQKHLPNPLMLARLLAHQHQLTLLNPTAFASMRHNVRLQFYRPIWTLTKLLM